MAADGDFDESFAGVQEADDAGSDFSLSSEDGGAFEDDDDDFDFEEEEKPKPKSKKKKSPARKQASPKAKKPAPAKKKATASKSKSAGKSSGSAKAKAAAAPKKSKLNPASMEDGGLASAAAGKLDKGSIKEKDAGPVLLQYLEDQNRPYSAINIHDNLHGAVKKVQVTRVLDSLASSGKLRSKQWGKFKVFWPDQARFGEISEESLREAERRLEAARKAAAQAKDDRKRAEGAVASLASEPTDVQLEELLKQREAEVEALRARVQQLRELAAEEGPRAGAGAGAGSAGQRAGAGAGKAPEGREELEARMNRYVKVWRQRKRKCDEVTGMIAEGLGLKRRRVEEDVGVETDQDVGCPEPKAFLQMPIEAPAGAGLQGSSSSSSSSSSLSSAAAAGGT